MRTRDLAALQAAVETGSLSGAARRLGCSQSGLSRRLQRLEAELGAPLLVRSAGGVEPTAAGARAVRAAEDVLEAVARLRLQVGSGALPLEGTVRVVASTTPGDHLVPRLVATFQQAHPAVRVDVLPADSAAVPAALLERRADLGFTGRPEPGGRLEHLAVAADEVVLAVPRGHRLAGAGTVPLSALTGERLVWRESGSGTLRSFLDAVAAAGQELPAGSSTVSVGSGQAVVAAVRAGSGVGVVSILAAEAAPDVVALRVAGIPVLRRLWLVHERGRRLPPAVEAFRAHAAAQA